MPAPVEAITLDDKLAVTRHLSGAGANIEQLNAVRKQLSRIKGGGLLRACRAGRLVSLIISDVLGDRLAPHAERLLRRTTAPIVTSLKISGDGVRATAPAQLPDLFAGAPVLISLELDPAGGLIEVGGDGADGQPEDQFHHDGGKHQQQRRGHPRGDQFRDLFRGRGGEHQ